MAVSRINEAGLNVNQYGNRNLIINGGMQVAQRGSVAALQTGYGACDRFKLASNSAARFDTTQSTDVPSGQGFANSLKLDCSTADTSVAAGDYYFIQQLIEGQNLQQLAYGTSSAKQMTLSFWVKSPKTGIHNLEVESADGGVFNIHQYTIASANTWQNVKMTIDGYQTTAIANDDTAGLNINWWLLGGTTFSGGSYSENTWTSSNGNRAVGQVNVSDSTSNDFYITGVQLEVGDTATDFEHRSYGDEVVKCQRYYYRLSCDGSHDGVYAVGNAYTTDDAICAFSVPVAMRTEPALGYQTGSSGTRIRTGAGSSQQISQLSIIGFDNTSFTNFQFFGTTTTTNLTIGQAAQFRVSTSDFFDLDAEL